MSDQTERAALLPCPFCGKSVCKVTTAAELAAEDDEDYIDEHSPSWAVICDAHKPNGPGGCGASGGFFPSEAEAVSAWQARAAQPVAEPVASSAPFWLIERGPNQGQLPHCWWKADETASGMSWKLGEWVYDATKATRYATSGEAEYVAKNEHRPGSYAVTSHGLIGAALATHPAPAAEPLSDAQIDRIPFTGFTSAQMRGHSEVEALRMFARAVIAAHEAKRP